MKGLDIFKKRCQDFQMEYPLPVDIEFCMINSEKKIWRARWKVVAFNAF